FREIIAAQGGDEKITSEDIEVGDKIYTLKSNTEGVVIAVNNKTIMRLARSAGAPKDKGAGVYVHKKRGEVVKVGEPLLTIYAEKEWKLDNAIEIARIEKPIVVSGMILEVFGRG
ncbi:MAG: thymidine phosphorylase, partial [Archaeoglobaceae archaeon]|nr:thymidine phosphorylase [Archaeoglobaceae archaeon]MDW7989098.1 thymidine phosphorylase [Archaeoglobaceae archaeon]